MNSRAKEGRDFMVVLSCLVAGSSSTHVPISESIQPVEVQDLMEIFFFFNWKPFSLPEAYSIPCVKLILKHFQDKDA